MAWCHQNHCWLLIKGVPWHWRESNFTKKCSWVESWVRTWVRSAHHYSDVIMSMMASQITSSAVCSNQRSKKTSKFHVTGLPGGNPPLTGGFPSQRASNMENVSIWWRRDGSKLLPLQGPVLPLRHDAVARVLANGSAAFFESCTTIGWKDLYTDAPTKLWTFCRHWYFSNAISWIKIIFWLKLHQSFFPHGPIDD